MIPFVTGRIIMLLLLLMLFAGINTDTHSSSSRHRHRQATEAVIARDYESLFLLVRDVSHRER